MKQVNHKLFLLLYLITLLCSCLLIACNDEDTDEDKKTIIDEPALKSEAKAIYQFADYSDESTLVKISIKDYGDIYVKLFPEYAPKAVERFLELIDEDYYDDLPIRRCINNYLIQSGKDSEYEELDYLEDELDVNLHPYRGALCMANEGEEDTNGTEFMIIQSKPEFLDSLSTLVHYKGYTLSEYLHNAYGTNLSDVQLNSYMIYGGTPWLYGHHTVFGQMYDGFEVLDSIITSETTDDYVPVKDIVIEDIIKL